jgi:hypothetical protein
VDGGDGLQIWSLATNILNKQALGQPIRGGSTAGRLVEGISSVNIVVFNLEKKCFFVVGSPRRRWEVSGRKDLREIRWEALDWIHVAQDWEQWRAVVNTVMKLLFA